MKKLFWTNQLIHWFWRLNEWAREFLLFIFHRWRQTYLQTSWNVTKLMTKIVDGGFPHVVFTFWVIEYDFVFVKLNLISNSWCAEKWIKGERDSINFIQFKKSSSTKKRRRMGNGTKCFRINATDVERVILEREVITIGWLSKKKSE